MDAACGPPVFEQMQDASTASHARVGAPETEQPKVCDTYGLEAARVPRVFWGELKLARGRVARNSCAGLDPDG